jgi:hypothetical protein
MVERLADTCCSGYFNMLGVLSGDSRGLQMLDRGFDCGNTPEPYAKAYITGAQNCQMRYKHF